MSGFSYVMSTKFSHRTCVHHITTHRFTYVRIHRKGKCPTLIYPTKINTSKRGISTSPHATSPGHGCNITGQRLQHPRTRVATYPDNGCNITGQRLQHSRTMVATYPDNGCNIPRQWLQHHKSKNIQPFHH